LEQEEGVKMMSREMELERVQEVIRRAPQVGLAGASGLSALEGAVQPADAPTACAPRLAPVTYHAIDINEASDKPRFDCRKVPVRLTVMGAGDAVLCATEGRLALNRMRVQRLAYEAVAQGGILSREDLAFLLGVSLESVGEILAYYGAQGEALPCDGGTNV
jgi:hypothetical protein